MPVVRRIGPIVKWYNSSFAMRDWQFDSAWVHKQKYRIYLRFFVCKFFGRIELGKGSGKREFSRCGIIQTEGFESAALQSWASSEFCLGPHFRCHLTNNASMVACSQYRSQRNVHSNHFALLGIIGGKKHESQDGTRNAGGRTRGLRGPRGARKGRRVWRNARIDVDLAPYRHVLVWLPGITPHRQVKSSSLISPTHISRGHLSIHDCKEILLSAKSNSNLPKS